MSFVTVREAKEAPTRDAGEAQWRITTFADAVLKIVAPSAPQRATYDDVSRQRRGRRSSALHRALEAKVSGKQKIAR